MALDKQRILSDLGSVMNQLQNADCGCMGKLFSNPNGANVTNMNNPGSCGRYNTPGCCHNHNWNQHGPNSVEPCSHTTNSCAGRNCDPAKLYAETFNYLKPNLMQPIMQEVHDDLKDISPANTIMNNPMGAQMGLSPNNNIQPSQNDQMKMGNPGTCLPSHSMNSEAGGMAGFGPQIVNMMFGNSSNPNRNQNAHGMTGAEMPDQGKPGQGSFCQDLPSACINQEPYPVVSISRAEHNTMGHRDISQNNMNQMNTMHGNMPQSNIGSYHTNTSGYGQNSNYGQLNRTNPQNQNITPSNSYLNSNTNQNMPSNSANNIPNLGCQKIESFNSGPSQQMSGMHAEGIAKFKEMFPGVIRDDLGFDPISIALQMNPANQQKVAVNSMNDMMNNKNRNLDSSKTTAKTAAYSQPNSNQPMQQQHQAYTAVAGSPMMQQFQSHTGGQISSGNQILNSNPVQQTSFINPNTGAVVNVPDYLNKVQEYTKGLNEPIEMQSQQPRVAPVQIIREPIYPVDNSRNICDSYNTLGQPVHLLPATSYKTKEPILPQTLSPQPCNVRATVSKTSLMGIKPVGKTPSRNQLQHIYNQYKGSQSYTQQNIVPIEQRIHSDGRINVPKASAKSVVQGPVERVGGDTLYSNPIQNQVTEKVNVILGRVGDEPNQHKAGDGVNEVPTKSGKCRNGLQDQSYSAYPTGRAWTFYGTNGDRVPFPSATSKRAYRV